MILGNARGMAARMILLVHLSCSFGEELNLDESTFNFFKQVQALGYFLIIGAILPETDIFLQDFLPIGLHKNQQDETTETIRRFRFDRSYQVWGHFGRFD